MQFLIEKRVEYPIVLVNNQMKTKFRLCEQQNQKEGSLLSKENVCDGFLSHISEYTTIT